MRHRILALAVLGAALVAAGCGRSTSPSQPSNTAGGTSVDQAAVSAAMASRPALVEEDVYESNTQQTLDQTGTGFALIRPLRFWRVIDNVTRTIDTQFMDPDSTGHPTRALVTVNKRLQGHFNILVGDTTATDTSLDVIHKPLDDHWVRRLALRRVWMDSTGTRVVWRVVGTSGVQITSAGAHTQIMSLRVQAGALDTTITDPLQLHRLRRLIELPEGTPVTLTATTGAPDDVVLFYGHDERRRFHANGDNTYTFQFMTGDFDGPRNFGVNALSHGTLFDDQAPYDSQTWIVPFAVHDADCDLDHD